MTHVPVHENHCLRKNKSPWPVSLYPRILCGALCLLAAFPSPSEKEACSKCFRFRPDLFSEGMQNIFLTYIYTFIYRFRKSSSAWWWRPLRGRGACAKYKTGRREGEAACTAKWCRCIDEKSTTVDKWHDCAWRISWYVWNLSSLSFCSWLSCLWIWTDWLL